MSVLRSKKRASVSNQKAPQTEERTFNRAYVIPAQMGDQLILFLQEMPKKYDPVLDTLIKGLQNAFRADVTLNVPKPTPTKPVKATPVKPEKEEKDEKV